MLVSDGKTSSRLTVSLHSRSVLEMVNLMRKLDLGDVPDLDVATAIDPSPNAQHIFTLLALGLHFAPFQALASHPKPPLCVLRSRFFNLRLHNMPVSCSSARSPRVQKHATPREDGQVFCRLDGLE